MQKEALQRHRVLSGQEEGGLRNVLAHREHLAGALKVEENAGPAGVVDVPVVFQKTMVEQAVVPDAGGLHKRIIMSVLEIWIKGRYVVVSDCVKGRYCAAF